MKKTIAIGVLTAGLLAGGIYGSLQWAAVARQEGVDRALTETAHWAPAARLSARRMVERYGPPDQVSPFRLRWDEPWPWKRIVVQDEPRAPLEQVLAYPVPPDKAEALRRFPHGLRVYADEGALGARSDSEDLNRLSLNLAADIVSGRTTPEAANSFYVRTTRLRAAGKSSLTLQRLLVPLRVAPDNGYPVP